MPFLARKSAVLVPLLPPPMTTTAARGGSALSEATGSTRGALGFRASAGDRRNRRLRCRRAARQTQSAGSAAIIEPDIERRSAMGQPAGGNEIDAARRDLGG